MYRDRTDAGHQLAERLGHLAGDDVVVLGLPRGGVPVAAVVAEALDAPLDVLLVRKLGAPFQPELAMGALGEDGVFVRNDEVLRLGRLTDVDLDAVAKHERRELDRRARQYRGTRPAIPLSGRIVVIVDDGIATGSTATAACLVARHRGAARVILAAPVGAAGSARRFRREADELVVLDSPRWLHAVGQAYQNFTATTDDEVVELLARADRRLAAANRRDEEQRNG
jgi:putative phosphoribosyl transferase